MIAAAQQLERVAADAWMPKVRVEPDDFATGSFYLSESYEGRAVAYDLAERPWWREILQALGDPAVQVLNLMCATQVGKTLALIGSILYVAEHAPAPGLVCLPDQGAATEFRDRLYSNAEESVRRGRLSRVRVPPERRRNMRYIDLGTMRIYLAWSGARQRLRGRPCRYVWLSEIDVYRGDLKAGDPVASSDQRVKAFYRSLRFRESSPKADPSRIANLEGLASDRRRWWCECPHCGLWQLPKFFPPKTGPKAGRGGFGGIKDEGGNFLEPDQVRKTAHYVCEAGCKIHQRDKDAFVLSGRWVSVGQYINRAGVLKGKPPPSRRSISFQLWAIHSDVLSWGDIAASHAEALAEGTLTDWYGNWLGVPYRSETRIPSWKQLARKLSWPNNRGQVPAEAWFLTLGADVQEDKCLFVVRGWAPGVTSWLVDWGCFQRDEDDETELVKSDLKRLGALFMRRWPVMGVNPLGRQTLALKLGNVDSNYRTIDVHEFLRAMPDDWVREEPTRIRAVRGDHRMAPDVRYRLRVVETNTRTGQPYEGGLRQWGIYVAHFYNDLAGRLAGDANRAGSWYVTQDAIALGKDYLQQVTNFHRVVDFHAKTGRRQVLWRPRSNMIPVDYWDCEIYALTAAHMAVGDLGWNLEAWEQWRAQQQPPPPAEPAENLAAR